MDKVIIAVVAAVVAATVSWFLAIAYRKRVYESKIGKAEEKSREIIDEALKTAETKKKEALLEAKEEALNHAQVSAKDAVFSKAELDDYEKEKINAALIVLASAPKVKRAAITYFRPDKRKTGGAYITASGEVARIDKVERLITLVGGYAIRIDDILEIDILE